jgi:Imm-5 like putative immunity protein
MKGPGAKTLAEEDRQILAAWAADCAERVLPLFESRAPNDARPRQALDGLRAFARGQMRVGPVRALAAQAHAAARDVSDPAATAAARAVGQAAAVAHMASHAYGITPYAAIAQKLAYGTAAAEGEKRWLCEHMSPAIKAILRKLPDPAMPGTESGEVIRQMHAWIMRPDPAAIHSQTVARSG